jgi:Transposase
MIVIGTDTQKKTHTCAAVDELTAAARGELTAPARKGSFGKLLRWARKLDPERVWAIEDCRHVSGALERFLIARGERIVRVAPKHMAGARRSSRERGKSDSIDAFSVGRAALKEGVDNLPGAHLDGTALDIRLLVDHREDLIAARTGDQQGCAGICTTCGPSSRSRPGRSTPPSGWESSPAASPAPGRRRACGSHASSCARSPCAPPASASSSQSSPGWSKATRRSCWPSVAVAR